MVLVMDEATQAAAERANTLLGQLLSTNDKQAQLTATLNSRIQAIKNDLGPEIEIAKQHHILVETELLELLAEYFEILAKPGIKTIYLRDGQISKRFGPKKLEVLDDEQSIIGRIRKAGGVKRFIKRGKETIDKVALKKHPEFVSKIKGLTIGREENVVIKPAHAQGEIVLSESAIIISSPREN